MKTKNFELLGIKGYKFVKPKSKKSRLNLATLVAIPILAVASHMIGYAQAKFEDYLQWRQENSQKFSGWQESSLLGKIIKESAIFQVYRHKEDTSVINSQENKSQDTNDKYVNPDLYHI